MPDYHMSMGIEVIFKIAAIGLITAVVNILLKKADKDELATLTTIAALVIVLLIVVDMLIQLFSTLQDLFNF
ncbi:MAG: stage III sporulation protein AC [Clostridia bacterium]|nr:stage III sporulation protein AC [Clostridia bacterium]